MWCNLLLFFMEFSSIFSFKAWFQDPIQIKARGYIFMSSYHCLLNFSSTVSFFLINIESCVQSVIFWIWMGGFWFWYIWKLVKKVSFYTAFGSFLIEPPAQLWNCGPDLSIQNTVWLGWENIKIDSEHVVKKKPKIQNTEKENRCPNFRDKFQYLS